MRLISIILGLLACLPPASYADQNLQARFEKSLKDAASLGNVEIEFLDTYWLGEPAMLKSLGSNKAPFPRTAHYSYIASGLKYRARKKPIPGAETNLAGLFESTFDGESFSSYDGGNRYMTRRSSNNPAGDNAQSHLNPLIAPFMFLTRHSDDCMVCGLHFTDIVSMTNALVLPKGQRSGGLLEISMPGLPLLKQPTIWKMALDETGDSFTPKMITVVIPGARREYVHKLQNYTNLGSYQFPTRIEWASSSYPPTSRPTLLETGLVTVVSALIPEQIADSVFRLDNEEKSAAVVWDWDQHKLTKSAPELARAHVASKTVRNIFLLILFITAALTIIVVKKLSLRK